MTKAQSLHNVLDILLEAKPELSSAFLKRTSEALDSEIRTAELSEETRRELLEILSQLQK